MWIAIAEHWSCCWTHPSIFWLTAEDTPESTSLRGGDGVLHLVVHEPSGGEVMYNGITIAEAWIGSARLIMEYPSGINLYDGGQYPVACCGSCLGVIGSTPFILGYYDIFKNMSWRRISHGVAQSRMCFVCGVYFQSTLFHMPSRILRPPPLNGLAEYDSAQFSIQGNFPRMRVLTIRFVSKFCITAAHGRSIHMFALSARLCTHGFVGKIFKCVFLF